MANNKTINVLLPFRLKIPDKFEIKFEDNGDKCCVYYAEEFANENIKQEEIDKTFTLLRETLRNIIDIDIKQNGNKLFIAGEVSTTDGFKLITSEIITQAIYYIGKKPILDMLDAFPDDEYVSTTLPVLKGE